MRHRVPAVARSLAAAAPEPARAAATNPLPTMPASALDTLVTDLAKLYALVEFFPLTHPTAVKGLQSMEADLLKHGTELHLEVAERGFRGGGVAVASRSPHAERFAARLTEHGVWSLGIRAEIGSAGLGRFLSAAALPPRVARAGGGFATVVAASGALGVTINDERIYPTEESVLIEPPPSATPAEQPSGAPSAEAFGVTVWTTQEVYEQVRASASQAEAADLAELRRLLREGAGEDPLLIVQRLELSAQWLLQQGRRAEAASLVEALREDAEALAGRAPVQRGYVMQALVRVASLPVIEELVARLGAAPSDEARSGLRATLVHIGADAVGPVVRALIDAPDLAARRAFRDALVALDYLGVPIFATMIGDDRWFVIRNMVGILGEIRSADALDHFARTIEHEDARVRRETISALTKLGGEDTLPLLLRGLRDQDPGLRATAALGIGLAKCAAGAAPLLEQLGREVDEEAQIEIIRALGRLGDARAIPALTRKAGGGGWFTRNSPRVRSEAARALAQIGGG